jgi:hypothetical protein
MRIDNPRTTPVAKRKRHSITTATAMLLCYVSGTLVPRIQIRGWKNKVGLRRLAGLRDATKQGIFSPAAPVTGYQ